MEKRFANSEWSKILAYAAYVSELAYIRDEMQPRLEMVENGPARLEEVLETAGSLLRDLLETAPPAQRKKLRTTFHDYKIQLIPMLHPGSTNVLMTKEQAKTLVDLAQEKCKTCVEDAEKAVDCPVFKVMETTAPLNRYDSMVCPYALASWSDE